MKKIVPKSAKKLVHCPQVHDRSLPDPFAPTTFRTNDATIGVCASPVGP